MPVERRSFFKDRWSFYHGSLSSRGVGKLTKSCKLLVMFISVLPNTEVFSCENVTVIWLDDGWEDG